MGRRAEARALLRGAQIKKESAVDRQGKEGEIAPQHPPSVRNGLFVVPAVVEVGDAEQKPTEAQEERFGQIFR